MTAESGLLSPALATTDKSLSASHPFSEDLGETLTLSYCEPCQPGADAARASGKPITVSMLSPKNRLYLHAGVDTLMVYSTNRPFPAGMPLLLLPDSQFGFETNSLDLHARQSFLGALFEGSDIGPFQTGAQFLTFLQDDDLTADEHGLLVYYAYGVLMNNEWKFAAGLQQDVFNPVSPTVVFLSKMYASGNTGSYRGQLRAERYFHSHPDFGVTIQAALSEPLSTLVAGDDLRITEDNGWPNTEGRIELGCGPASEALGVKRRPLEIGVSGVVGQFRTTLSILGTIAELPLRAVIDTWGVGADFEWRPDAW